MDNNELKTLQNELLRLLKVFTQKCDENKITYYLFFGSLLGAVRHNGFIPWDDDVDLAMPREDYKKFISIFKDKLTDDISCEYYSLDNYISNSPVLRINSNKLLIRRDRNKQEHYIPVFLSVFPIDGLPNNTIIRKSHIRKIMIRYGILRASRSSIYGLGSINNRTWKQNIIVFINKFLKVGNIIKPRTAARILDLCMQKYPIATSQYCYVIDYDNMRRFLNTADFLEKETIKFEDITVSIPKGYETILHTLYNNYMELPPPLRKSSSAWNSNKRKLAFI